jgi:hypothetical protein
MKINIADWPIPVDLDRVLDQTKTNDLALTRDEGRLIGDLLGQKDAGIEMLSIRLKTSDGGRTIQAEFRTPLGTFAFNDCDVALDRTMAPLIEAATADKAGGPRLARAEEINADRYAQPIRKIRFE